MPPVVISAEHLSKRYRITAPRYREDARDAIASAWSAVGRRLRAPMAASLDTEATMVRALDDVSFEIRAGETVGILGRNGAGKSTLLKVIAEITQPTTGWVDVTGRVGSLLEVGTGFHGDLSGRENAYLNGAILGMKKADVDRKFDEIVAFAEIDRFIDTPVKYYSSGMYMRLAFAVAAHLDTAILVVDEVLAVGDSQFQRKCLGKMDDIAGHGRTVLLVSHNLDAIQRLCRRALLFETGRLVAAGPMGEVVAKYRDQGRPSVEAGRFRPRVREGSGWARITDVSLVDDEGTRAAARAADDDLIVDVQVELTDPGASGSSLQGLVVDLSICSDQGQPLISLMSADEEGRAIQGGVACRVTARLRGSRLMPGRYRLNVSVGFPELEDVDVIRDALDFEIVLPRHPWRPSQLQASRGPVCLKAAWTSCAAVPSAR